MGRISRQLQQWLPALSGLQLQPAAATGYYRQTLRGRQSLALDQAEHMTPHLRDLLIMCGEGVRSEELRQFMPPRSLHQAIRSLLDRGLIEDLGRVPEAAQSEQAGASETQSHQHS